MKIAAAMDVSSGTANFAVAETPRGRILVSASKDMRGGESSKILPWIESVLKGAGCSLEDISEWTVGTGPGSFTGLRIIAALVSGLTFADTAVRRRGIPSAFAVAAAAGLRDGERAAVLSDGGKGELFCCGVERLNGNFFLSQKHSRAVSPPDFTGAPTLDFNKIAALGKDREAVLSHFPPEKAGEVVYVKDFPAVELLFVNPGEWKSESILNLVYVRPPVFFPRPSAEKR